LPLAAGFFMPAPPAPVVFFGVAFLVVVAMFSVILPSEDS
jgi:hypothetical protein